jgi:hypothetical protein
METFNCKEAEMKLVFAAERVSKLGWYARLISQVVSGIRKLD